MSELALAGSGLIIVAHPDDEVLWAGGTVLTNPQVTWTVVSLCRGADADRSPKFFRVMRELGADGFMGDMDDGPEQAPLAKPEVEQAVLSLVPRKQFDFIMTHGPAGEYTRHLRHEETSCAVQALWRRGKLAAGVLWLFAYEDGGRAYPPRAVENASRLIPLNEEIHKRKQRLITEVYGFDPDGFEGRAAGAREAFWVFNTVMELDAWLQGSDWS